MKNSIYCIMIEGISLTDSARNRLFEAAWYCLRNHKKKSHITHDDVRGTVTTEFKSVQMGGSTGIEFAADIATLKGGTKVTYFVSERDMDGFDFGKGLNWIAHRKPQKRRRNVNPSLN